MNTFNIPLSKLTEEQALQEVEAIIDRIGQYMNTNENHVPTTYILQKLWYIISALRGPDYENVSLKTITTGVIRGVIARGKTRERKLIDTGKYSSVTGALLSKESNIPSKFPKDVEYHWDNETNFHFRHHIKLAVDCLQDLGYTITREVDSNDSFLKE